MDLVMDEWMGGEVGGRVVKWMERKVMIDGGWID